MNKFQCIGIVKDIGYFEGTSEKGQSWILTKWTLVLSVGYKKTYYIDCHSFSKGINKALVENMTIELTHYWPTKKQFTDKMNNKRYSTSLEVAELSILADTNEGVVDLRNSTNNPLNQQAEKTNAEVFLENELKFEEEEEEEEERVPVFKFDLDKSAEEQEQVVDLDWLKEFDKKKKEKHLTPLQQMQKINAEKDKLFKKDSEFEETIKWQEK